MASNSSLSAGQREPLFLAPQPLQSGTGLPVIQKVFIANRGEIACRIIATCRKLGIQTALIYVQEDEGSRHVVEADDAIHVGSIDSHSVNPFLNVKLLVEKALEAKADAIHPGYGYLSENADFATQISEAGMIFVGPAPSAMSTLGDKRSSKEFLQKHAPDVPLIPGFSGSSNNIEDLQKAALEIGYPVLLKASAGGGGKGMRVVREPSQLQEELNRVQSEASRSFGSSDCILEKYIESSKHIEIQILGDNHGNVVNFFERDCSVQRRHQKVIEESPCPFITEEIRQDIGNTAVRIAKLIGYANAGTVEFVFDVQTSRFFFLEVNARLQVEHPITEEMTGTDLVALQLFAAAGGNLESLPHVQNLKQVGHAIECRLCAEDPRRDFFPEHGKVRLWKPASGSFGPGRDIRYETAIQTGSDVSIYFDSMIAKLVVWAPTRSLAIQRMTSVLAQTACVGVRTNQHFLQQCLRHPKFHDPSYNTSFIAQNKDELFKVEIPHEQELSMIPSYFIRNLPHWQRKGPAKWRQPFYNVRSQFRNQHHDPINVHCDVVTTDWLDPPSKSVNEAKSSVLCVWSAEQPQNGNSIQSLRPIPLAYQQEPEDQSQGPESASNIDPATKAVTDKYNHISTLIRQDSSQGSDIKLLRWIPEPEQLDPTLNIGNSATVDVLIRGSRFTANCVVERSTSASCNTSQVVFCHFPQLGTYVEFQRHSLLSFAERSRTKAKSQRGQGPDTITAPMPCKVLSVQKQNNDKVEEGDVVLVIESMKMEVAIKASKAGKFETKCKAGDAISEGEVLCNII